MSKEFYRLKSGLRDFRVSIWLTFKCDKKCHKWRSKECEPCVELIKRFDALICNTFVCVGQQTDVLYRACMQTSNVLAFKSPFVHHFVKYLINFIHILIVFVFSFNSINRSIVTRFQLTIDRSLTAISAIIGTNCVNIKHIYLTIFYLSPIYSIWVHFLKSIISNICLKLISIRFSEYILEWIR